MTIGHLEEESKKYPAYAYGYTEKSFLKRYWASHY